MSLAPVLESSGTLEAVVQGCTVAVHGIRCRYTIGHPTKPDKTTAVKVVGEVRITLPVARCQVLWSFVEMPPDSLAEPGAAPSGGPATRLGSSGVSEGPPSVS